MYNWNHISLLIRKLSWKTNRTHLAIYLTVSWLIVFLLFASSSSFQSPVFRTLFPGKFSQAANSIFFDHFTSPSLNAIWTPISQGGGTLTLADSNAQCTSPLAGDACAFYYSSKIDKNQSGIFAFAISNSSSTFPQTWLSLINSTNLPTPDTSTNIDIATRFRIKTETQSSIKGITVDYYDTSHVKRQWNGTSNTWTSTPSLADNPITGDDYYVVAFENDSANNRFRSLIWAKRSSNGNYTFNQGLRLFTLTNWVSWTSVESSNDLWLVLGDLYTNLESGTMRVEWARFDGGVKQDVWTNSKAFQGDTYVVRHGWGYESVNGTLEFIVQEDRSTFTLGAGPSGSWDSANIKDQYIFFDPADNTYYMVYAGSGNGSGFQIGLATSSSPNGTFTRYGTVPIVPRVSGGQESQISGPNIVKDLSETDPNKMFKMLYTGFGADSNFRVFYATAPDMRGPWTKQGVVLDIGAPGSFDQNGVAGPRTIYENDLWYVFLGAKNNSETGGPWRITYATGPTLSNLTKSGVILVDKGVGPAQNITANISGRTVKVASTAGFVADAYIEIDQDSTANNYGQSRIRKVVDSTTLELYHGLNGFTTTTPAKIVQVDGANRIAPADIRQVGSKWEMQVTPFQFFGAYPTLSAHDENMGLLTADSITGPYTWNHLATPSFTRGSWRNQVSNENLVFLHTPITTGPIPTSTPTPSPTPSSSPSPTPTPTSSPTPFLYTKLDSSADVSSPTNGTGTGSSINGGSFVLGQIGNGFNVSANTDYARLLQTDGVIQNVELDKGTIDFWYKPSYSETDGLRHSIFSSATWGAPGMLAIMKNNSSNNNVFSVAIFDANGVYKETSVPTANYNLTSGTWANIKVTWDTTISGQMVHVYFDGVEVSAYGIIANGPISMPAESSSEFIYIGNRSSTNTDNANGVLDEVKIYNSAINTPNLVNIVSNISYGPAPSPFNLLDVYMPNKPGTFPAVVWIHGGRWKSGSKSGLIDVNAANLLAQNDFVVFNINYRLSPGSGGGTWNAPAHYDDVKLAIQWVKANGATYNAKVNKVGGAGCSAGGHLSMRGATSGLVRVDKFDAVASWSGPTHMSLDPFYTNIKTDLENYIGCTLASCPANWDSESPALQVDSTDSPILIVNSDNDPQIPLNQAQYMDTALTNASVPHTLEVIPGVGHCGYGSSQSQVEQDTVNFLHQYLDNQ